MSSPLRAAPLLFLVACASPTVVDTPFPDATARADATAPADAGPIVDAAGPEDAEADGGARDAEPTEADAGGLDAAPGDAQPGPDRPAGMSTPPTPRQAHTMIVLADGRVLVAGGLGSTGVGAESYIYDPVAGFWTTGPAVEPPRGSAPANLLADGRVLITGGAGYRVTRTSTAHRSSLLFDPRTAQLTRTGDLVIPRIGASTHPIVAGPDRGKLLVLGGYSSPQDQTYTVEVYDPATGTYALVPGVELPPYLLLPLAAGLPDGRVLLIGRLDARPLPVTRAHIYDPATHLVHTVTSTPGDIILDGSVARLGDGRILVMGVPDPVTRQNTAVQIFDPATETFLPGPSLPEMRRSAAQALLPDGRLLLLGGADRAVTDTVLVLDAAATTWSLHPRRLTMPLAAAEAVYVGGPVLVVGGQTTGGPILGTAQLFQP